jgi:hypothetical protein
MSTYVYICNLEVRVCNLLLNPYTRYFFLSPFLFQLERNNFKQNSALQWAKQISCFFHLRCYLAQSIGIVTIKVYHKFERGSIIYTIPITMTYPKKNNLLVF